MGVGFVCAISFYQLVLSIHTLLRNLLLITVTGKSLMAIAALKNFVARAPTEHQTKREDQKSFKRGSTGVAP